MVAVIIPGGGLGPTRLGQVVVDLVEAPQAALQAPAVRRLGVLLGGRVVAPAQPWASGRGSRRVLLTRGCSPLIVMGLSDPRALGPWGGRGGSRALLPLTPVLLHMTLPGAPGPWGIEPPARLGAVALRLGRGVMTPGLPIL
jgi:hypothetical protein